MHQLARITRPALLVATVVFTLFLAACSSTVHREPTHREKIANTTYPLLTFANPYSPGGVGMSGYVMDGTILPLLLSSAAWPMASRNTVNPTPGVRDGSISESVTGSLWSDSLRTPGQRAATEAIWEQGGIVAYPRWPKGGDVDRMERCAVNAESEYAEQVPLRAIVQDETWYGDTPRSVDFETTVRVRRRIYVKESEEFALVALCELDLRPIWEALRTVRVAVEEDPPPFMAIAILESSSMAVFEHVPRYIVLEAYVYGRDGMQPKSTRIATPGLFGQTGKAGVSVEIREALVEDLWNRDYEIPGQGKAGSWPLLPRMDWESVMPDIRRAAAKARFQF